MNGIVKYIGFYDLANNIYPRLSSKAAIDKMNYISQSLQETGKEVEIISPSWIQNNNIKGFEKQKKVEISRGIKLISCASWPTRNKVSRNIKIVFSIMWLFFFLLFKVKKNEQVIVYHTPWLSLPIRMVKFFKKILVVLEVEEIYQDVSKIPSLLRRWEDKLINCADSYILSTELLLKRVKSNTNYIVVHGNYGMKADKTKPLEDGKIHLVYAGIIDSHKKGAFNALEASKFLSEKYFLHIIGFGEVEKLQKEIEKVNKTNECKVSYDGEISGEKYISFCQSCHIGLSTQSMKGEYLNTSFPSKVLSYLSMGLRVISPHIDCVSKSAVGDLVNYYYEENPRKVALAIESIDFHNPSSVKSRIKELDRKFKVELNKLLGEKI